MVPQETYIFTEVLDHAIFQREGANLFCQIPISMVSATLGGDIEAPTLDGGKTRVKFPPGFKVENSYACEAKACLISEVARMVIYT